MNETKPSSNCGAAVQSNGCFDERLSTNKEFVNFTLFFHRWPRGIMDSQHDSTTEVTPTTPILGLLSTQYQAVRFTMVGFPERGIVIW